MTDYKHHHPESDWEALHDGWSPGKRPRGGARVRARAALRKGHASGRAGQLKAGQRRKQKRRK